MVLNPVAESYLTILGMATRVSKCKDKEEAKVAQGIWRCLRGARLYDVECHVLNEAATVVSECLDNPSYTLPSMKVPPNALFVGADLDVTSVLRLQGEAAKLAINAVAYLIQDDGACWIFLRYSYAGGVTAIMPMLLYPPGHHSGHGSPLHSMLAVLSRVLTDQAYPALKGMPEFGQEIRRTKKKLGMAKVLMPTAPSFHEAAVPVEKLYALLRAGIYPTHFKFMRGDLPVSEKRLPWLRKNDYVLFAGSIAGATQEILDGLKKNGVWAPEPWEWLAVKVTRVGPA